MKWLRKIWYRIYYFSGNRRLTRLAQNCKSVVRIIDLERKGGNLPLLHLSLCQPCRNYYEFSKSLRRELKKYPNGISKNTEINHAEFQAKLLKKLSSKD